MSDFFSYQPQPAGAAAPAAPAPTAPAIGAELGDDEWAHLIRFAARRRYPAGAQLWPAGEADRALHFIASGRVELTLANGQREQRGEGEVLGLMSFLDGAPSAVSARVAGSEPAELLRLTPEALQQLAAWQPRVALLLWRDMGAQMAARLRRLSPAD
jgi:CRP-like cAMP-binding protein